MKIPRTIPGLIKTLKAQSDLLEEYYFNAFTKKDIKYLGEVAGKLRLLVYEGGSNIPLLLSLMDKLQIDIPIKLDGPSVQPLPSEPGPGDSISLRKYLEMKACYIKVKSKLIPITKRELIAKWSQQFGSAHQDWSLDEDFYNTINSGFYFNELPISALELKTTAKTILYVCEKFLEKTQNESKQEHKELDPNILKNQVDPNLGTLTFWIMNHNLFSREGEVGLFEFKVDDIEFLLKRNPKMELIFQHSNSKNGTRISKLDLNKVGDAEKHFVCLTWSDKEVNLSMCAEGKKLVNGVFEKIPK